MASSTRRRACTGGQRQSYKRAGYLTRSSGPVSRGLVGTATEPRSSSWRGRTRFLGRRERGCGCWGTRSAPTPLHSPGVLGRGNGGARLFSVAFKALPCDRWGPASLPSCILGLSYGVAAARGPWTVS